MNDREGLCRLWQSQPVEKGRPAVPRFALTEDSAVPFYMPLSRWRRLAYGAAFVCTVAFSLQSLGHGSWPEYVATSISVLTALIGIGLLLWQRDGSPTPNPEECVDSYRTALTNEFERQFKTERLIVILLFRRLDCARGAALCLPPLRRFPILGSCGCCRCFTYRGRAHTCSSCELIRSRLNDV
jgi:hypothetical protein